MQSEGKGNLKLFDIQLKVRGFGAVRDLLDARKDSFAETANEMLDTLLPRTQSTARRMIPEMQAHLLDAGYEATPEGKAVLAGMPSVLNRMTATRDVLAEGTVVLGSIGPHEDIELYPPGGGQAISHEDILLSAELGTDVLPSRSPLSLLEVKAQETIDADAEYWATLLESALEQRVRTT